MLDSGEDGLAWWANTAQGTGYVRFKNTMGNVMYNFNSDFGGQVYKQFTVGIATGEEEFYWLMLLTLTSIRIQLNRWFILIITLQIERMHLLKF